MKNPAEAHVLRWALTGIPLVLFLCLAFACFNCTVDDAFISFRCADNLARGDGPVFNIGERVEAFSNPLWVLILALVSLVRLNLVSASKIIGLGCGVVTLIVIVRLCRRTLGLSYSATLFSACYLATNISFAYYAISGLETAFYMMALALMICFLAERREVLAGVACAVLAVTRPEGILYAAPLALGCWLNGRGLRKLAIALLIPIAAYGLLVSLRLLYFGSLLPNSYAAKIPALPPSLEPMISRAQAFKQYTWYNSAIQKPFLFLVVIGAVMFLERTAAPMIASVGVASFFVWYGRGDWMSFWRFYAPVVPFMAIFLIGALERIRMSLGHSSRAMLFWAIMLLPLITNGARTITSIAALERGDEFNPAMHSREHVRVGKYLATVSTPSDAVVVNEIGAIGYYSHCTMIDMLGLTDSRVPALLRRSSLDAYADYLLGRTPAFVLLNNKQTPGDAELHPVHAAVYAEMMKTGLYRIDREFPLNRFKKLMLFVRENDGTDHEMNPKP